MLRRGAASVVAVLLLICLYPAAAFLGAVIPVNRGYVAPAAGTTVWLCAYGVHTDLVLGARGGGIDWPAILPAAAFRDRLNPDLFLSFGWGDRDFYMQTPNWSDFKPVTALHAIAGGDAVVVHVEARWFPGGDPECREMVLDPAHLSALAHYVRNAMDDDATGHPIAIPNAGYGADDGFFLGKGHYSILLTCNDWLRRGLVQAGIRTALWSPLPFGILWQAERLHKL